MQTDAPNREADDLVTWINQLVSHHETTVAGLAALAGVSQSVLSRIVRGETSRPTVETLSRLASRSPIAVPLSVQKLLDRQGKTAREHPVNIWAGTTEEKIPVWGLHPMRRDAEFHLNPIPISFLNHPRASEANLKLAAFYAPDETMAPRWHAGEPVLFDRMRAAATGEVALIKLTPALDPDASETYLFRQLLNRSNGVLHYRALQSEEIFKVPIDRIIQVRRVLTWSDLLV